MSVLGTRTVAAGVLAAAALSVGIGVSLSNADEPKAPKPQRAPLATPGEFGQAQDQLRRAMEALAKDPNDPAARKLLDEAWGGMMKGFPAGPGGLPGLANPALATRPRLGVQLEPLAPIVSDQLGLDAGVAIAGVLEGSAAEKAGFKVHDIVVEFAGKAVSDPADFVRRVGEAKAGEKVDAVVVRKGKKVELKGIELPAAAQQPQAFELPLNPRALDKGRGGNSASVSVSGDTFTIDATQDGVTYLITGKVGPDGVSAEKVSVKAGDEAVEAAELGKVPEKYRPTVERLLKLVGKPRGKVID
ncbi:PDZ domain-containing protein [Gemmata sp. JC673]|uniref:PDZ domain-containing protein n=1 Tax=Gemmata algarum TaxID=2975278 RepID=A0ABU5EYL8_9BACT|nr:PDZ domain-containing protein [Gemmata algarum]MDY3560018.1 PDZ domain-containing protein [Gemmata algarum]